ncbi:hypothetical protein ACK8P5_26130 (plasmid) [Paenibacillus sp. EC2-1]|uniref:hypothetical protein n=1 Tax=Paenibacillus sp. EC2-1 TaxID=3388665 RepID=UPI003BEF4422
MNLSAKSLVELSEIVLDITPLETKMTISRVNAHERPKTYVSDTPTMLGLTRFLKAKIGEIGFDTLYQHQNDTIYHVRRKLVCFTKDEDVMQRKLIEEGSRIVEHILQQVRMLNDSFTKFEADKR